MVAMNVWPTDASDGSVATEARWRKMGRLWERSGVDGSAGGFLAPSLSTTNLTVKAGAAWVDGHYCELLGDQVLNASGNGLAVVRFDPAANTAELLYVLGATVPTQNPSGIWELPIASVAGGAMTDLRGGLIAPKARPWAGAVSGGGGSANSPTATGVVQISMPAQSGAGKLMAYALLYVSKTVNTDVYVADLVDGVSIVSQSRADTANSPVVQFAFWALVNVPANTAKTITLMLSRAAGSGSGNFTGGVNTHISAIFIPD